MLFLYHDLPKVHASNAENASHYSINPTENSADERKPLLSEASEVLTDTSTTDDVGKQKLNNFTARSSRKRSRTLSVMENWHLVSG